MQSTPRHQCLIYDRAPNECLHDLAALIAGKLDTDYRCFYLNSPGMVAGIRFSLAAIGVNVGQQVSRGALVLSSSQDHLVDGRFDADKMLNVLTDAIDQALSDGFKGLFATGDMTWEFGPEDNFERLLEYERKLEEVFSLYPSLCGVCQYYQTTLPHDVIRGALQTHQAIYLNETLSRMNPFYTLFEHTSGPVPDISDVELSDLLSRFRQPKG